jgi:hypothetical protein
MNNKTKLIQWINEYKGTIEGSGSYYLSYKIAVQTIEEIFDNGIHIYKDNEGFPTHFFLDDYVYIFGSGIYKKD